MINRSVFLSHEGTQYVMFLNRVFSFLEVEPRPVELSTLKITNDDLREVIVNFDELRAMYSGTQYEVMFDEVLIT